MFELVVKIHTFEATVLPSYMYTYFMGGIFCFLQKQSAKQFVHGVPYVPLPPSFVILTTHPPTREL
jgi:hypothetical protein